MPHAAICDMAKKSSRLLSSKGFRKTIRKNPYTVGIAAAVCAVGGLAAAATRSPWLRERSRALTRRLSSGERSDDTFSNAAAHSEAH
jgi:hypothetical protein